MTTVGTALALAIIALPLASGVLAFAAGDRLPDRFGRNIRLLWAAVAVSAVH